MESNRESKDGWFDLRIRIPKSRTAIVLECGHAPSLDHLATVGAGQIEKKRYLENSELDYYENKQGFGIAFCKKLRVVRKI